MDLCDFAGKTWSMYLLWIWVKSHQIFTDGCHAVAIKLRKTNTPGDAGADATGKISQSVFCQNVSRTFCQAHAWSSEHTRLEESIILTYCKCCVLEHLLKWLLPSHTNIMCNFIIIICSYKWGCFLCLVFHYTDPALRHKPVCASTCPCVHLWVCVLCSKHLLPKKKQKQHITNQLKRAGELVEINNNSERAHVCSFQIKMTIMTKWKKVSKQHCKWSKVDNLISLKVWCIYFLH